MARNDNLWDAKRAKNDDFYTQLEDIEREMEHYEHHFRGKVVYCNCDDPWESDFFYYFSENFERLGLKRLITTCYKNRSPKLFTQEKDKRAIYLVYEGDKNNNKIVDDWEVVATELQGDGDFRSPECVEFLKQADIVVTNPPFSLFREYMAQLIKYNKNFLIIGNMNAISYKEIFPLIKDNKLWLGASGRVQEYRVSDSMDVKKISRVDEHGRRYTKVPTAIWFTNLEHDKRNEEIDLFKKYNAGKYPHYENYDAIEVGRSTEIPEDWDGVMGVPVSFLEKFNPNQFQIIGLGISNSGLSVGVKPYKPEHKKYRIEIQGRGAVDGDLYYMLANDEVKVPYARILIRRIQP